MGITLIASAAVAQAQAPSLDPAISDRQLYVAACANCHGSDGRGAAKSQVAFDDALPDFTDCAFSSRETAQDWFAVVHDGGPVRAFSHRMPAFGAALTPDQIERVVAYVRSICDDRSWPLGELNLPRAMATEKAFPEDETVFTMNSVTQRGARTVDAALIYEKRFGARNQVELILPFGMREKTLDGSSSWSGAKLGDIAFAFKRALYHRGESGRILSVGAELILPTGDTASGVGGGVTIFEPFVLAAQALPANFFLQLHGGFETPVGRQTVERAAYLRMAAGTTVASGFGRSWSPIVELIGDRELGSGAVTEWDWIPQMQVSLSKRQHILASVGVRLPLTERASRPRELVAYLLWDWFDGGFFSGW
jgi:mono/diheme cytochrome c family protein